MHTHTHTQTDTHTHTDNAVQVPFQEHVERQPHTQPHTQILRSSKYDQQQTHKHTLQQTPTITTETHTTTNPHYNHRNTHYNRPRLQTYTHRQNTLLYINKLSTSHSRIHHILWIILQSSWYFRYWEFVIRACCNHPYHPSTGLTTYQFIEYNNAVKWFIGVCVCVCVCVCVRVCVCECVSECVCEWVTIIPRQSCLSGGYSVCMWLYPTGYRNSLCLCMCVCICVCVCMCPCFCHKTAVVWSLCVCVYVCVWFGLSFQLTRESLCQAISCVYDTMRPRTHTHTTSKPST